MLPIDLNELFTTVQLYDDIQFLDDDIDKLYSHLMRDTKYDCYCVECGRESTFQFERFDDFRSIGHSRLNQLQNFSAITRVARCLRVESHNAVFLFNVINKNITKIGQFPSTADISNSEIKKYHTLLGNEKYKELNKAVGLSSHGIGIGSFVYLRRIFEDLIEEAHTKAKISSGWDDEAYSRSRMADKISALKLYLPEFLIDNKGVYSILSKGIHELSEQECLEMFPVMKLSIELILDEKLREKERETKVSTVSSSISSLLQRFKS